MLNTAKQMYAWASSKAHSRFSHLWLALVFLFELLLFVPFDALLMLFCMQNPSRGLFYAAAATLSSCVTGIMGYFVGLLLWDTVGPYIVGHLISEAFFTKIVAQYEAHESLAVFVGSLLPIPFKAVTLSAGFCKLSFWPYLSSVLLARALRFFFLAALMQRCGGRVRAFIDRHFGRILWVLGAKVALTLGFFFALGV